MLRMDGSKETGKQGPPRRWDGKRRVGNGLYCRRMIDDEGQQAEGGTRGAAREQYKRQGPRHELRLAGLQHQNPLLRAVQQNEAEAEAESRLRLVGEGGGGGGGGEDLAKEGGGEGRKPKKK